MPISEERKQAVFKCYVKHGRNASLAGRELGISRERVRQILFACGVESIFADRERAWNNNGNRERLRDMVRKGEKFRSIAAAFGVDACNGTLLRAYRRSVAEEYAKGETATDRRRLLAHETKEKKCGACEVTKPRSHFSPSKQTMDGLAWLCKPCATVKTVIIYRRRKAAGLCGNCGKHMDRDGAVCRKCCQDYQQRRRQSK